MEMDRGGKCAVSGLFVFQIKTVSCFVFHLLFYQVIKKSPLEQDTRFSHWKAQERSSTHENTSRSSSSHWNRKKAPRDGKMFST
jgi:hypothetical protein